MRSIFRYTARVGAAVALVLAASAGASTYHRALAQPASAGTNVDWPRFGNTADNTRFSQLNQITTSNVGKLGLAWTMQEGSNLTALETDPVVVNGVLYWTTNADQVRAVEAATGKLIWQYTPKVDFYHAIAGGGGGVPTNRGVEVANGRVYLLTFDNQLISLQAATGEKLWSTVVADPNKGYSETAPPTYWNGLLFVGSAESDAGLRGFVAAYDAKTGKQVWRFYTVPDAGQGWMPAKGAHGGGDVWMPSVVDNKTGILYFGTGNPSPDLDNSQRPGCNPWVDATVALDAKTGKFIWGHTEVCNDTWDYDSHQPPMIFDVTINGKTVHAVGHGNKSGLYFVYDAATGKVLAKSPHLSDYSLPHLKPNHSKPVLVCPGATGGIEYSPPAYSPMTHFAYEPGLNTCANFMLAPQGEADNHKIGTPDFGGAANATGKVTGFMAAVDTTTGKIAWKTPMPKAMIGGALATAGNLVFSGSDDGSFYAFDATTGKIVWKAHTGLATGAAPITYMVNGTQYVAVAFGGAAVAVLTGGTTGGTFAVFKLNGKPVDKSLFPAVVGNTFTGGMNLKFSTKGLTKVNPWMYMDKKHQSVTIMLVAAATADNNGFNFDGYSKGKANFVIPVGWSVNWIFSNKAALPHSAALSTGLKQPVALSLFGGNPVETPLAMQGIGSGKQQYVGFPALHAGRNYLVCLVPGHLQAGMWDYFTVDAKATAPSVQTS